MEIDMPEPSNIHHTDPRGPSRNRRRASTFSADHQHQKPIREGRKGKIQLTATENFLNTARFAYREGAKKNY
jgi:hypothetical protein